MASYLSRTFKNCTSKLGYAWLLSEPCVSMSTILGAGWMGRESSHIYSSQGLGIQHPNTSLFTNILS